jgi:flavin reductase (DIM6/NTAB) family NADH-FMN oxidoreductase RutF
VVASAFDRIAAGVDPPMVVVTARVGDAMDGCLVGFSTQCSIDPQRYLVCLSKANATYDIASDASSLVVHLLPDNAIGIWLARIFGEITAHAADKLSMCAWGPGVDGAPVIASCDWFAGPIASKVDLGDHVGFVLDITAGNANRVTDNYLGYSSVRELEAGNPP